METHHRHRVGVFNDDELIKNNLAIFDATIRAHNAVARWFTPGFIHITPFGGGLPIPCHERQVCNGRFKFCLSFGLNAGRYQQGRANDKNILRHFHGSSVKLWAGRPLLILRMKAFKADKLSALFYEISKILKRTRFIV